MTTVPIDPQAVKRLTLIRLLYRQGVEQSGGPESLAFTSVLSFHDAVEMFLVLAGEHLQATLDPKIEFLQYWKRLRATEQPNPINLSGQVAMRRLNDLRVALKHTGTMPGREAIEQTRADVRNFFEDNTPTVFGVDFDTIDMADLVPQDEIRSKIKAATVANASGDRAQGMALLLDAYDALFDSHTTRRGRYPPSPLALGGRIGQWGSPLDKHAIAAIIRRSTGWHVPTRNEEKLAEQIAQVTDIVMELQAALRVTALDLDLHRSTRFQRVTPTAHLAANGHRSHRYPPDYAPSQNEFDFCHEFVVTAAMRLAEFDAHLRPLSWERESP